MVYPELRRIARNVISRERNGHILQPTSLVHEAFFRLFNGDLPACNSSQEFFAAAVRHMRWVLTDYARKGLAAKRREEPLPVAGGGVSYEQLLDLNRALDELEFHQPQAARIVELKYYVGLSIEEIAAILEISPRTVVRNWDWARAWLQRYLGGAEAS
jgi:RNA polymerase sigma factor (TIGR02999 family)